MSQMTKTNKVSYFFSLLKQSLKGGEHDYTEGSIKAAIVLLAIPMILELSLESIFAVVDLYFVSHLPNSTNAVTTVGLTESVITLVYTIAMGLSAGATAVVARRTGEKNAEGAAHAGAQSLLIALLVTAIVSIAGFVFAPDILRIMGAAPEVIKEGTPFTRIMFGGSIVIILLFLINGIFRGVGDAAMAMRSLWIASIINIILCPVLINGVGPFPELGLTGAAIATTIGRGTGVLYQCYHLFRGRSLIKLKPIHFKWDIPVVKTLFEVAWPATVQFFIMSGSFIVLAYLVSTTGGTNASAGYQTAIRNVVFFILPAWGLSNAAATLVGQNLGAGNPERAAKSVILTAKYNAVFMALVTILFVFFSSPIISIFNNDPEVHKYGALALQIIGTGYIFYGIGMVMVQSLNGAGDTKTPTWINLICFWFFQIPLAWFLVKPLEMGPVGAFIAMPVAETVLAVAAWYYFKKGKWKEVKV
jgi:putative MATE family efflux protein